MFAKKFCIIEYCSMPIHKKDLVCLSQHCFLSGYIDNIEPAAPLKSLHILQV